MPRQGARQEGPTGSARAGVRCELAVLDLPLGVGQPGALYPSLPTDGHLAVDITDRCGYGALRKYGMQQSQGGWLPCCSFSGRHQTLDTRCRDRGQCCARRCVWACSIMTSGVLKTATGDIMLWSHGAADRKDRNVRANRVQTATASDPDC